MADHSETDISIIIVNYKTPKLLYDCIESIIQNGDGLNIEIIVVDNDSKDDSEKLIKTNFTDVIWKNMGYNSGFSRANNAGIKLAKGDYILLLNSDTVIIDDCLQKSLDYYKNLENKDSKVGLLGCKMKEFNGQILLNSNDSFPKIKKIWNANPIQIFLKREKQGSQEQILQKRILKHSHDHQSGWLGAAFVLCNRKLYDKEKLFMDQDFFMYGEDMEWCYRIAKKGYHYYFYSQAEIFHFNCGSSGFSEWKTGQILISEWLYFMKIKGKFYFFSMIMLLMLNHLMDSALFIKQKLLGSINENDIMSMKRRRFERSAIRRYFFRILFHYNKKESSCKNFLKYEVK